MKGLWRFRGGVHLEGSKEISLGAEPLRLPTPRRVVLPLQQHIGSEAEPVVAIGDRVAIGQPVARASGFVSAPVHASVSGVVVAIGPHPMPHPSGIAEPCIVIESDAEQYWWDGIATPADPATLPLERLRERIRDAGIVGLGGAVFPAAAKLSPPCEIEILVINGVECEPYITCDDMLMRLRPDAVIKGAVALRRVVAARRCVIAVEDNKPQAVEALRLALQQLREEGLVAISSIEVATVPTLFPAGGEKQLIKVLTGREVPVGGLPYQVGAVCLNVGTTAAVHDALYLGRPLVERWVTVTGPGIRRPGNYVAPLGTPVTELLAAAGGTVAAEVELFMGGPMMGQRLPGDHVMVVKGCNCILVQPVAAEQPAMPCIRCGSCASACPMQLLPQQLYWHARGKQFDLLERYNLGSCIECGCCAVVCPSNIPLVSYFRYAKSEIAHQAGKRQKAAEARLRNQRRTERLEAQRREAEARKAERKAGRRQRQPADPAAQAAAETGGQQA
jgi:Na+-translocating ferredoxin:NAD+ oxidoreductase subunit C